MNLTTLAEYGFDHGYLSCILSGKKEPSLAYAKKVAKCLGILDDKEQPDVTGLLRLIEERKDEMTSTCQRRLSR